MAGMKVDFNALRRQACNDYDLLTKELQPIAKGWDDGVTLNAHQVHRLSTLMDSLRYDITSIAICYDEHGNEDVLGERDLLWMRPEEEEELP